MKIKMHSLKRTAYVAAALTLVAVSVLSGFRPQPVQALQVTTRSIRMSSSASGATNVIYMVGFTIPTTGNIGGMAIDFCEDTPIIGDPCDESMTGFSTNDATLSINNQSGITDFAIDTTASVANTVVLTRTAASVSATTAVSFELGNGTTNGFTNPNDIGGNPVGSFYARIYTYTTTAAAQGHNRDAATGYVDYGGIALSTARVITITARVQEQLSFCVYQTACGDDPSFTIGHDPGSGTLIIDSSQVDTHDVKFSVSTNANSGAIIRMKGDTLKDPQGNDINAIGNTATTFTALTENFGLRVSTAGTNITGTAPYNGAANNYGLMVTGGGSSDVTSTYGGQIADLTLPTNNSVTTLTFAAQASNTTPAGTYTASQQLIATGSF